MAKRSLWRDMSIGALSAALTATCSFAAPDPPKCRGNARLVGDCFTVHGRMREGNGTPAIRIWRVGTDRLLGVNDPGEPDDYPAQSNIAWLPAALYNRLDEDHQIFADFLVCPLTKQTEDAMQIVCIESASRIVKTVIPPAKKEE
jgi:hypothetical protein